MLMVSRRAFVMMIVTIEASTNAASSSTYEGALLAVAANDDTAKLPDETNTGFVANTGLKPSSSIATSRDGQIIRGLDVLGTVRIEHDAVTLENCRITAATFSIVTVAAGVTGAVIRNCEINGIGINNEGSCGISGHGTFVGNNIYNVENGMSLAGNSSVIENNYIHSLRASGSPHYDGIQIDGGVSDVIVRHNTIINEHSQTSAVMIDNWAGPISNILVEANRLIGGGYTVYSDGRQGIGPISQVSFINNRIGRGHWGYRAFSRNMPIWTGNVDDLTGRPI